MKPLIYLIIVLLTFLSIAQGQERDSLIIEGANIDSGAAAANVRIWAVTFDSVYAYAVNLRWYAPYGGVSLSPSINYSPPLPNWDILYDSLNIDFNYISLLGFEGLDTLNEAPIFTNGQRINIITLHFIIAPGTPPQTVDIDTLGAFSFGNNPVFVPGQIIIGPLAAADGNQIPKQFTLLQNYPNPFNAQTTISYNLPEAGSVTLTIYDIMGQKVATLVEGIEQAGEHQAVWDAGDVTSGVYFYIIQMGNFRQSRGCMFLK